MEKDFECLVQNYVYFLRLDLTRNASKFQKVMCNFPNMFNIWFHLGEE